MHKHALIRSAPINKPIDANAKTIRLAHARRVLAACERRFARRPITPNPAKRRITYVRVT